MARIGSQHSALWAAHGRASSAGQGSSRRRGCSLQLVGVACILGLHASLLAYSAWKHSPVVAEIGHLPAGMRHLQFGTFNLYAVNPPLVQTIAAIPALVVGATCNWSRVDAAAGHRTEIAVGRDFILANGERGLWLYSLGRWACIPFSLIGALVCYQWSYRWFGSRCVPAFLALLLWCFSPAVLGHGALIMPDIPGAALGAAACYAFWRWLEHPDVSKAAWAGICGGVACVTKTTLAVYIAAWPLLWLLVQCARSRRPLSLPCQLAQLCLIVMLSLTVLNAAYAFQGSWRRLDSFRFHSCAFTAARSLEDIPEDGLRFRGAPGLGRLHLPVPSDYIEGIDIQEVDFERKLPSYLCGTWSSGGWWYFYLCALAIKIPLGTWALLVLGTCILALSAWQGDVQLADVAALWVPPLALLALVSSHTGFTIHTRYVFAVLPAMCVTASASVLPMLTAGRHVNAAVNGSRAWRFRRSAADNMDVGALPCTRPRRAAQAWVEEARNACVTFAVAWTITSSIWQFPHSLAYFNEVVGDCHNGHNYLLHSNCAWGQDLLYLRAWYERYGGNRPVVFWSDGPLYPRDVGISGRGHAPSTEAPWYVIDANHLHVAKQNIDCAGLLNSGWLRKVDDVGASLIVCEESRQ